MGFRDMGRDGPASLAALRCGSVLPPVAAGLVWGWWAHRVETAEAVARTVENAALVRQYADRLIQTQTVLQTAAREHARHEGLAFLRSEAFHRYLAALEASQSFTLSFALVGRDGAMVASSRTHPLAPGLHAGPRLAPPAAGGGLVLDRVSLPPHGRDALAVATPFEVEGFEGAVVTAVAIDAVTDFLEGIAAQKGEAASLLREDGRLLVRNLFSPLVMLPRDAPSMRTIGAADEGRFRAAAVTDGVERLHAFSRLQGPPVFAVFGTPVAHVTQAWLIRAAPVWALLAALGGFSFILAGQVKRALAARREAEAKEKRPAEAEALAEQRTRLMQETHHRVKNNLALVVALIGSQMRAQGGIDGDRLKARVHSISEVHDLIYHSHDGAHVDLGDVLRKLCASPAVIPHERGIAVTCEIEARLPLGADMTTPLAIIATELMTNAVKHAFEGREGGAIAVGLRRTDEGAVLEVRDDGPGLPPESGRNSGTMIVGALIDQIGGRLERTSENGARSRVHFPLPAA